MKSPYRSNINAICSNLRVGYIKPQEYREKSQIIRRGRVLEDGSILWIQDGKLSIESAISKVAQ
jgi:hypothetical protein